MAIQTQVYSYGSLQYGSATNGYVLELTVQEESVSQADNTSTLSYTLKLISGGNNRFDLYHIGAQVWLNGTLAGQRDRYSTAQVSLGYHSSVALLSGTAVVTHNADGRATIPVSFSIDMESGTYVPGSLQASGYTMELTDIPRESSVRATDAQIGAISVIAVTKQSQSATHSIAYCFGALSGYLTAAGDTSSAEEIFPATSILFAIPEQFYGQIPNAASGECTLTVKTYFAGTAIGTSSCSFTVTAGESQCAPEIGWNMTDISETTKALTGDAKKLIRYYSTAHCEIQVTAKHGATACKALIGNTQVALSSVGYGTLDIYNVESGSISCYGEDSRGYGKSKIMTAELIPYIKLTNRTVAKWTDIATGEAKLQFSGACYDGSFGATENQLYIGYRAAGDTEYTQVTAVTLADGKYTAEALLTGLDYRQDYAYEIRIWDALATIEQTVTLAKSMPVFHWGESDFQFCVPVGMNRQAIKEAYSVNGLTCGGVAFGEEVIAYLPIRDRTLMLFGLAGNTGEHALYLVMFQSQSAMTQCVRLSGTLDIAFSLEGTGLLKIVSPSKWSYGWYVQNSDYKDIYYQ